MPGWLTRNLRLCLEQDGCPFFQVRDGPERMNNLPTAEPHIVLERDDEAGDTFIRPIGTSPVNPTTFKTQQIGMRLLVFARAAVPGATTVDHEDEGDRVIKQVLWALYQLLTDRRWEIQRAGYLSKAQVDELAFGGWPGRIYQLLFTLNVGLEGTSYQGEALEEIEMGPGGVPYKTETEVDGGQGGQGLPQAGTEL